jgi:hypothetical protein
LEKKYLKLYKEPPDYPQFSLSGFSNQAQQAIYGGSSYIIDYVRLILSTALRGKII